MEPLDLPLELFQHIFHDLVEYCGPVQAVKLRLVCSKLISILGGSRSASFNPDTFANVIQANVLTGETLKDIDCDVTSGNRSA